jgi:hypothetical protein
MTADTSLTWNVLAMFAARSTTFFGARRPVGRTEPAGANEHVTGNIRDGSIVILDNEIIQVGGVEQRLQPRDTGDELLLQHARLSRNDALLHRRQPGLQATHEDFGIWHGVPNQVEFRSTLDCFRDQQPHHARDAIVRPERREIPICQVAPRVVRNVTNPKRVQADCRVHDARGREKVRGFRHHGRLAGSHVTSPVGSEAAAKRGKDVTKVGIGAGAGAAVGAIAGGGKGAAIGALVGGGAGAAMRGEAAEIPAESVVSFELRSPVTIRERK